MTRLLSITLIVSFLAIVVSCSESQKSAEAETEGSDVDLTGSWKRIEYIDHEGGGTEWLPQEGSVIYEKNITPTHFTWVAYDTEDNTLQGAGGGTYKIENGKYVEHIEFFHPVGSGILGQNIKFDVAFEDGTWLHTGYAKNVELDPESGENVVTDSTKIEEKWVRIEGNENDNEMLKTWHLERYKAVTDSTYNSYPEFVGYMKLLTPSRFIWIQYNNEDNGGEVIGLGSGSWSMEDGMYRENIKMIYPSNNGIIGSTAEFSYSLEDGKWYHKGVVPVFGLNESGERVRTDSTMIDEIWIPEQ